MKEDYSGSMRERLTRMETMVDEIRNNHLVHLEAKVDRITWLIIVTLVGIVANLIDKFI